MEWWGAGRSFFRDAAAAGVKSGKVRRAAVAPRDRAIIADRAAGMSLRAIASKHGLKLGGVQHVLRRDAPLLAGGGVL